MQDKHEDFWINNKPLTINKLFVCIRSSDFVSNWFTQILRFWRQREAAALKNMSTLQTYKCTTEVLILICTYLYVDTYVHITYVYKHPYMHVETFQLHAYNTENILINQYISRFALTKIAEVT